MSSFEGLKVLIVEDDPMLREVLKDLFAGANALVLEAENGAQAVGLAEKEHIDIIFSDARMPGGDGLALARSLQKMEGKKPILFLCSGYNDTSPEEAAKLNIAKVFEKPFDQKLMLEEILNAIKVSCNPSRST
jgi:CheY-like chemotaxis protein